MAPKSSDEETKGGGSLIVTTDPMKISNLGEREGVDDDDEEDNDSDSDSNWDKDSFDGREYHTSDHSDYSDEDLQRRARFYNRKVIETKVRTSLYLYLSPLLNLGCQQRFLS